MAANSLSDSYETLVDTDNWMLFAAAFVGFMAPVVIRNLLEGVTDFDVPDEVYGVLADATPTVV